MEVRKRFLLYALLATTAHALNTNPRSGDDGNSGNVESSTNRDDPGNGTTETMPPMETAVCTARMAQTVNATKPQIRTRTTEPQPRITPSTPPQREHATSANPQSIS